MIRSPFSQQNILKTCVFFAGTAGIVCEYVLSTLASYLLGNTVLHWTLVISSMLFAMGVGSRITRSIENHLPAAFVAVELVLSLAVGMAVPVSYLFAGRPETLAVVLYSFTGFIGILIGMELPLVARINSRYESLALNLSNILEKDYWGALLGGIFFAWLGLPYLGLTATPVILGFINFLVALLFWRTFRREMPSRIWGPVAAAVAGAFVCIAVFAKPVVLWSEQRRYVDQVVYQEQTRYQMIVLTRWHEHIWLYLDGHQQFSSYDEARYHESMVHPAMLAAASRRRVLILGGGDGLVAREVLKHPDVESVTLVELDPAMIRLATQGSPMAEINGGALRDPRLTAVEDDGYRYLQASGELWDVILVDLPDPRTPALERLYSLEFYRLCGRHLSRGGVVVTQATSPYFSRDAFWCIVKTLEEAGFQAFPWHTHVPTMGEWGWVMGLQKGPDRTAEASEGAKHGNDAMRQRLRRQAERSLPAVRYLTPPVLESLFVFSPDDIPDTRSLPVHSEFQPVLHNLYSRGDWALF